MLWSAACAGTMGPDANADDWWSPEVTCPTLDKPRSSYPWERVITASIGPAFNNNNGETQTFYLQPDIQKTYAPTPAKNALIYGELLVGLQKQLTDTFISQFGLAIAGGSDANLNGDIWEDADPAFNNYTYSYYINEARITAKGNLLIDPHYYGLRPYVSAGIGVGFNTSHGFTITADIPEEIPAPAFQDNTNTAITYTLGLGVQKAWSDSWYTGIGYEFANWGKSQLAPAIDQTLNQGLSASHIYMNTIQLSLTYIM